MQKTPRLTTIKGRSGRIHVWDELLKKTLCGAEVLKGRVMQAFARQVTCPSCTERLQETAK